MSFERGASFTRTAYIQRRGFGLSDRITHTPTVEQQADDILAVMDAIGMRRAILTGTMGACGAVALIAARAPERVSGLILLNPIAQGPNSTDEAEGWTDAESTFYVEGYREAVAHWGSGQIIDMWDPAQATGYNRRLMALLERSSATPASAQAYFEWILGLDIQDVLKWVQVPTRVLRLETNAVPGAATRYVAQLIPGATFHVLPATLPGFVNRPGLPADRRPHRGDGHGGCPLRRCRPLPRHGSVPRRGGLNRIVGARRRRDLPQNCALPMSARCV